MAQSDRPQQSFEVYRKAGTTQAQDDDSKFWLLLVLVGLVALGVGGAIFASGEEDTAPPTEVNEPTGGEGTAAPPAPQSVFDRLDWIQEQEGAESALALAEDQYLVEYPNAPNLLQRIAELKNLTTVVEDVVVRELREDARRQVGAGKSEQALDTIAQILERTDNEDGEALYLKAQALFQMGDTFGASGALEEAEYLEFNPVRIEQLRQRLEGE